MLPLPRQGRALSRGARVIARAIAIAIVVASQIDGQSSISLVVCSDCAPSDLLLPASNAAPGVAGAGAGARSICQRFACPTDAEAAMLCALN